MKRRDRFCGVLMIVGALTLVVVGVSFSSPGSDHPETEPEEAVVMYGFNRSRGELLRHVVGKNTSASRGVIATAGGDVLYGIDAAAYIPGFQNLFAFWSDPQDGRARLAYVDVHTAEAQIVPEPVEGGRVTGAVAVAESDTRWTVYAVQRAESLPPRPITGTIRLNPNNSPAMQFEMILPAGAPKQQYTRDDLADIRQADLHNDYGDNATLYEGEVEHVRIRPMGRGRQQALGYDGEPLPLHNSSTYTFLSSAASPMKVRLYNPHLAENANSNSMGHWYLDIEGAAYDDNATVRTPRRLVSISHRDLVELDEVTGEAYTLPPGAVTELFPLQRDYDALASRDGLTFYATSGDRLYRIDRASTTETRLGYIGVGRTEGLAFAGDRLMGFDTSGDRLIELDPAQDPATITLRSIGADDLGATVLTPDVADPVVRRATPRVGYD